MTRRRKNNGAEMTLLEHLEELRQRLVKITLALVIGTAVGMFLAKPALELLVAPLKAAGVDVRIDAPTQSYSEFFKAAVVVGAVLAMPVIIYQVFRYVAPGLLPRERRYILTGVPIASLSFAAGVAFAATVLLPNALPVMTRFLNDIFFHQYSVERYMSFVSNILLWTGLIFETPLVMYFLAKLGVVTPKGFAKARRVVIIGAATGAAIITPTVDPVNMLLVMGPFLLLYEFGILLARFA